VTPVVRTGAKREIEAEDIPQVLSDHKTDTLGKNLEAAWKAELDSLKL